jgi:hypothetical protein
VEQTQLFQIDQTAPPRRHLLVDGGVKPSVFAAEPAKRPNQGQVADDIHHFPIDGRRSVGEFVMQRPARGGKAEHRHHQNTGQRH